LKMFWKVPAGE